MIRIVKKYKYILLLFLISTLIQILKKDLEYGQVIGSLVFLFVGSLLLSGGAQGIHKKYNAKASLLKWWVWIYAFMILIAAIPE